MIYVFSGLLPGTADIYRKALGDISRNIIGEEIRTIGIVENPKPLSEYQEDHPYMVAYYDLADMPTMTG